MPSVNFSRFDVVVVPFPFTDKAATKRRPALVLSDSVTFNQRAGHGVMAMITSAVENKWPQDVPLQDIKSAGLSVPCSVRFKLFTLDNRLVLRTAGKLAKIDRDVVDAAMRVVFGIKLPTK